MTTLRTTVASVLLALPAAVVAVPVALPADVADPHVTEEAVPDVTPSDGGEPDPRDATGDVVPGSAEQITFGIAPAGPDGADGRVSFRLELEPGASHTDHVEVANYSEEPITLALLASDGTVTAGGNFDVLPSDVAPEAAGSWVEIDDEIELEPMGSAVVPFTVSVPDGATPGDQPTGIVASLRTVGSDGEGSSVALDSRAGARLHLRVAGDLVPALAVGDVQAEYRPSWNPFAPGTVDLSWTVENEGNVRLGAAQVASVEGLLGLGGGEVAVDGPREVLPGQSATHTASVEAWPTFRHGVDLRVTPVVVGADEVAGALTDATASVALWTVPWAQLAVVVLLALAVVTGVRRRRRQEAAVAAAVAAARAEALRSDDVAREPLPARG
ncbi:protein of unknown function [Georgenia satyanarayanai]|uniref:DUF916 domain-containing protein n=1 Tax=Georgenia satyanarayanai TaxID=860221 RepID=A0A2Y9BZY2_9MICO|nr:DUF916 domain-containing protein [Georgenia satyanarayanai]PYF98287.1 uncharacterized protein DUF916 [Georgenia satyanarayanai]SSA45172.1 protein of unknown function [Georgenia satyanarayanai]